MARPLRDLEIGVSPTAQWCHEGACGLTTFATVVPGKDCVGKSDSAQPQTRRREFRWDLRWRLSSLPLALYFLENVETADPREPLLPKPPQTTNLVGVEFCSRVSDSARWRVMVKWAGTTGGKSGRKQYPGCTNIDSLVCWRYF